VLCILFYSSSLNKRPSSGLSLKYTNVTMVPGLTLL